MEVLNSRPDITSVIETVSKEHGIQNYFISDVQTNEKGEGYFGQIFMVTVRDKSSDKQTELVVKVAFNDKNIRQFLPIRMNYENEIYFYQTLVPTFERLGNEHGVNQNFQFIPKCFGVSLKECEEMLVLENLKPSGFEILDKTKIMDEDHVKLMFQAYGKLHGYSFALRDQNPEEYTKVTKNLVNPLELLVQSDFFGQLFNEINKLVLSSFIPEEDDEIMKKYEKYVGENPLLVFQEAIREKSQYSVLLHGDCWSNNMLFKYEEGSEGKKPTEIRLIDWQVIRIGSPVHDLSYSLYSGTSKEIFDKLNEFLKIYHDSFSSVVKQLGSDPEKLFPFSTLKEEWKKFSKFGMIMAFQMVKLKLTCKEDIIDVTDGDKFDLSNVSKTTENMANQKFDEENYKKRIRELVIHMSEIGVL